MGTQPKKPARRPAFLVLAERSPYMLRTKSTSALMSASETRGEYGGIGTPPVTSVQLPLPPALTLPISMTRAVASPLYLAAMSFQDGPTTLLSMSWQARHPLF